MRNRILLAVLLTIATASGGCFQCDGGSGGGTVPVGDGSSDGGSDEGDAEPFVPAEVGAPERKAIIQSGTRTIPSFEVCAHLTGRQWEVCDDREYSRPWPDCIAEQNPLLSQRCWAVYRATKNPYWCEDLQAEGKGCEWLTWISIRRSAGALSVNPLQ